MAAPMGNCNACKGANKLAAIESKTTRLTIAEAAARDRGMGISESIIQANISIAKSRPYGDAVSMKDAFVAPKPIATTPATDEEMEEFMREQDRFADWVD